MKLRALIGRSHSTGQHAQAPGKTYWRLAALLPAVGVVLLYALSPLGGPHRSLPLPTPTPVAASEAPAAIVLPSVAPDHTDPLVGTWVAVHPSDYWPRIVAITKDSTGSYTRYGSDGSVVAPTKEGDGTLFVPNTAHLAAPWQRYIYRPLDDQLHLISADDTAQPRVYRRRPSH